MNTILLLSFIIFLLSIYILVYNTKNNKENYQGLTPAFIDLAAYGGIDNYLYNNSLRNYGPYYQKKSPIYN